MEVATAGGHGQIGLLLGKVLAERGHTVFGLIRNPDQEDDLHAAGVEPVLCDLEGDDDVAEAISGADRGLRRWRRAWQQRRAQAHDGPRRGR
ncbi:MAG: NAD(P)H-binding protein [Solirubrobacterales bacterium]